MQFPIHPFEITVLILKHAVQLQFIDDSTVAQISLYFSLRVRAKRFNTLSDSTGKLTTYLLWCDKKKVAIDLPKLVKNMKIHCNLSSCLCLVLPNYMLDLDSLVINGNPMAPFILSTLQSIKSVKKVELDLPFYDLLSLDKTMFKSIVKVVMNQLSHHILLSIYCLDTFTSTTDLTLSVKDYRGSEAAYQSTSEFQKVDIQSNRILEIPFDSIVNSSNTSLTKLCLSNLSNTQNLQFWIKLKSFKALVILNISTYGDKLLCMDFVLQGISDLKNLNQLTINRVLIRKSDLQPLETFLRKSFGYNQCLNVTMVYKYAVQNLDSVRVMVNKVLDSFKGNSKVALPVYQLIRICDQAVLIEDDGSESEIGSSSNEISSDSEGDNDGENGD